MSGLFVCVAKRVPLTVLNAPSDILTVLCIVSQKNTLLS